MRVEDLTKFEGECPNIVVFGTYMDIRVPLTKKWKKIINERGDKPNTYHNCLISYISEQIALSGFNMKSIGNLLIKGIVFNQNDYYKYNDVGGFPATINDLGYWDKNVVALERARKEEEVRNKTLEERIQMWKSGEISQLSYYCWFENDQPNVWLRIKNGKIETSKGIKVELTEAERLWRLIKVFHNGGQFQHDLALDVTGHRWAFN